MYICGRVHMYMCVCPAQLIVTDNGNSLKHKHTHKVTQLIAREDIITVRIQEILRFYNDY
jgi:hypothetical protein